MSDPVLLFVAGDRQRAMIQRQHDPKVLLVAAIGTCPAYRASAVIIHTPPRGWMQQDAWEDWLTWARTRLAPGCQDAFTLL